MSKRKRSAGKTQRRSQDKARGARRTRPTIRSTSPSLAEDTPQEHPTEQRVGTRQSGITPGHTPGTAGDTSVAAAVEMLTMRLGDLNIRETDPKPGARDWRRARAESKDSESIEELLEPIAHLVRDTNLTRFQWLLLLDLITPSESLESNWITDGPPDTPANLAERFAGVLQTTAEYLRRNHLALLSLIVAAVELADSESQVPPSPLTEAELLLYERLMKQLGHPPLDRFRIGDHDQQRHAERTPAADRTAEQTIAHTRQAEPADPHLPPPSVG